MTDRHIQQLEKRVSALSDALAKLGSADDFKRLILIMKRPGWTTPAEFIFASAVVDSMIAQAAGMAKMKGELLKGAEAVVAQ